MMLKFKTSFISSFAMDMIAKAQASYPVGIWYKGRITDADIKSISDYCNVLCQPYMDGSALYGISLKRRQL